MSKSILSLNLRELSTNSLNKGSTENVSFIADQENQFVLSAFFVGHW